MKKNKQPILTIISSSIFDFFKKFFICIKEYITMPYFYYKDKKCSINKVIKRRTSSVYALN